MAVADLLLPGKCSQEAPLEEGTKWRRAPDSLLAASMEPPADAGPARRLTGGYARGRGENLAAGETPEKAFDGQARSKWLDFGGGGPDSKGSWIEYRLPYRLRWFDVPRTGLWRGRRGFYDLEQVQPG